MKKEPVIAVNAITALVEAIIVMAVGFGLDWTQEQIALVMGVVIALGAVVQTVLARERVTPVVKGEEDD